MKFNEKFDKYVCINDTIETEIDGLTVTARIEFDQDTKPSDFDCYSKSTIKKWENDEWFFCGVVLSVSKNGVVLSGHASSLWGIECNFSKSNEYLDEVANELLPEAIEEGNRILAKLLA